VRGRFVRNIGVHGQRMVPAMEGGKPVESTVSIPIKWTLTK
jgi:hypothetical protein